MERELASEVALVEKCFLLCAGGQTAGCSLRLSGVLVLSFDPSGTRKRAQCGSVLSGTSAVSVRTGSRGKGVNESTQCS